MQLRVFNAGFGQLFVKQDRFRVAAVVVGGLRGAEGFVEFRRRRQRGGEEDGADGGKNPHSFILSHCLSVVASFRSSAFISSGLLPPPMP